uniref:Protein HTATIP2 n=1 Tax=Ditylenchus dipsaci TaxID=166011 RepID=A0A915DBI6_9BILA
MAYIDDHACYTGEVGKNLTRELLSKKVFKRVILLGRRTVDLDKDLVQAANAEQVQIDFDNIEQHKHVFDGAEVGFCCLGTTKGRSGKEGFIKVDHDYVVNTAKAAKESVTERKVDQARRLEYCCSNIQCPVPTVASVPVSTVAKAMIANLWKEQPENGVEFISNSAIHKMGDDYNKMFEAK